MISSLHSGISKVIRSSGQILDSVGKRFELHPYTDKRKRRICVCSRDIRTYITNRFAIYSSTFYASGKAGQECSSD